MKLYTFNQYGLQEGIRLKSNTPKGEKTTWYLHLGTNMPAPQGKNLPGSKLEVSCCQVFPPKIVQSKTSKEKTIWMAKFGDVTRTRKPYKGRPGIYKLGRELRDDKRVLILSRSSPLNQETWQGPWYTRKYFGPGESETFTGGLSYHPLGEEMFPCRESLEVIPSGLAVIMWNKSLKESGVVLFNNDGDLEVSSGSSFRGFVRTWKTSADQTKVQTEVENARARKHFLMLKALS